MGVTPASHDTVLELDGISKHFGATQALRDVDLRLRPGEVHALVGENGAGKSTLIKIVTGLHRADAGTVTIAGEAVEVSSPAEAQRLGVVAIYQEPLIFPDLTVAENIFMGHGERGRLVRRRATEREAAAILADLDIDLDPRTPASALTVAEQQAVEIAKAISQDVRVLIMDEPTAALSAHEVERLFGQVERLRDGGVAVLFISHRLDEVFAIADRVSVFRDGRHISTRPIAEASESQIVRDMVGRELGEFFVRTRHAPTEVALRVRDLSLPGTFEDVSFEVHRGEVLGFAGLVGAGRTDVALALFGITPAASGTIEVAGDEVSINSPKDALGLGIAYLSEDRRKLGLSLPQSIAANVTLPTLGRYTSRFGLVDRAAEAAVADRFRTDLNIRTPDVATPVGNLSGGNQQKTMLAKWLNTEPSVLILDEPTRGIDVGAKAEVHRLVDELARDGLAVILISSDLPEVLAMSDRILVMREGRVADTLGVDGTDQERVMTAAVGAR
ncbi:MAG: sugar ABC transporter ATP-binding protein [Actinomycetota bacterium]|nr:sugar ABC transporter ATP-binding protein [Actinomycetota bacterium]